MRMPRRGDVFLVDFGPAPGSEMRGRLPAVVIQNDVGNRVSRLTILAAMTGNLDAARLPVCVAVPNNESGLPRDSVVNTGHIYTIDKRRLERLVGRLSESSMRQVDQALRISVGLSPFDL